MSEGAPVLPDILVSVQAVMQSVTGIAKAGTYKDSRTGKVQYNFLRSADAVAQVGAAFREHGVMIQSRDCHVTYTENSVSRAQGTQLWTSARVEITYVFTSLTDGSTLEFASAGEGRDTADKATSKAMTMALKYTLTQAFTIATNEVDPDAERPEIEQDGVVQVAKPRGKDETDAQRQAREQFEARQRAQRPAAEARQATAAQTRPVQGDPLADAQTQLEQELGARPVNGIADPVVLALAKAHKAYTTSMATGGNPPYPRDDAHAQRAALAAHGLRNAQDRGEVDRIILKADQEDLLPLTVDGKPLAAEASAIRNTFALGVS